MAQVDLSFFSHWPEDVMQPLQLPKSLGKQVAKEKDIGQLSAELRLQSKSPNFKTSSVPTKPCPNAQTYTEEMFSIDPPTSCQSSTWLIVCPQPGAATVVASSGLGRCIHHTVGSSHEYVREKATPCPCIPGLLKQSQNACQEGPRCP